MVQHVLVVEDEFEIQELLKINLTMAGYKVSQAQDGRQALSLLDRAPVDIILMDWNLPGESGVGLVRQLRRSVRKSRVPVLMLSARHEERDKVMALDAGVDDYMVKPFNVRELLARVQALLRSAGPAAPDEMIDLGAVKLNHSQRRVTVHGELIDLGPTEYRLLHFLLRHPDRVYSRSQLLNHVWHNTVELQDRTVDVYIARVRNLLESNGLIGAIETIRAVGYRFVKPIAEAQALGPNQAAAVSRG
jgi:two-component system, OmpR family, phosphate regulon response regulator PhoB